MPASTLGDALQVTMPAECPPTLRLQRLRGREEISRLFRFELELLAYRDPSVESIDPLKLVGKPIGFAVGTAEGPRHFHGVISRFVVGDMDANNNRWFRAEVVPWLWLLQRTSDCRIFQNKTAVHIIEQVFQDLGFNDFLIDVKRTLASRDYCVQYRETDFNFVSRLMEEEGLYYYFDHGQSKHVLTIGDNVDRYRTCADGKLPFRNLQGVVSEDPVILAWERQFEFRTGKWAQTDYNFETPTASMMTVLSTTVNVPDAKKLEYYDYPGLYSERVMGTGLVKLRMEEEEMDHNVVHGASNSRHLSPGFKFDLSEHNSHTEEGSYIITSVQHTADETGNAAEHGPMEFYSNVFTCIPSAVVFRPARITPKPVIQGVQTAVVVGPSGQEVFTDSLSRIKVQFHWDREGKYDERSSCWIRVAQAIAGCSWGFQMIPRIGQEVVVDFLEGDPDRPLVRGSVNNTNQLPPWPGAGNILCIRSNSTKGGAGHNELMFDDLTGSEKYFLHAQKDMHIDVEHDRHVRVRNDEHVTVEGNQYYRYVGERHEVVVGKTSIEHVGNVEVKFHGASDITIVGDQRAKVDGGSHLSISGDSLTKVDGSVGLQIGGDFACKAGKNWAVEAGLNGHLKTGMNLVLEAATITLKGAGGFITIDPSGVSIQGALVKINSGGAATPGHGCVVQSPQSAKFTEPSKATLPMESKTGSSSVTDFSTKS
ncbi:MAG: type VI secretion system tip protein VgrG [Planctomyces sp.]|nr:type VI secretion system tip protein VgrG [Planctomyces sp.]